MITWVYPEYRTISQTTSTEHSVGHSSIQSLRIIVLYITCTMALSNRNMALQVTSVSVIRCLLLISVLIYNQSALVMITLSVCYSSDIHGITSLSNYAIHDIICLVQLWYWSYYLSIDSSSTASTIYQVQL